MASFSRRVLPFALAFALLPAIGTAQTSVPEPVFAEGDPGLLTCKVVDVRADGDVGCILTVEVANAGKLAAEPLEFAIEAQPKKERFVDAFQRVSAPRHRRFGHPVPAGGKEKYYVTTPRVAKQRSQYAVRVTDASWFESGAVERPAQILGKPQQVQVQSLAGTFPVTSVDLTNPFDRDLDVLVLVTFVQPRDVVELRGLRIPARRTLSWKLATLSGTRSWLDPESQPGCAMKASAFELVDWSLVSAPDPAAGAALLRGAYEAWVRWPEPKTAVGGRYRFRERTAKADSKEVEDVVETGRFTLDESGELTFTVESGPGPRAKLLLGDAFANVRREGFDDLLAKNQLQPIGAGRVEVRGPGFGPIRSSLSQTTTAASSQAGGIRPDVRVAAGRIVDSGTGDERRTAWETRELAGGYVLARTRSESTDTTFAYRQVGALVVPEHVTRTVTYGGKLFSSEELTLSEVTTKDVVAQARPLASGAGVDALRAAWDAAYRYPTEPIATKAAFEASNPGTDGRWGGVTKPKGRVEIDGVGRHMRHLHVDFDGKHSPEMEMVLVGALRDRLLLWYGVDFGDRPDFDEVFAGATIAAPADDGTFAVENARIAHVRTAGGLVRGWVDANGSERAFTYAELGGRPAVTRIELREPAIGKRAAAPPATVTIVHVRVGDHWLPSSLAFERIFGKDWGPETIVFKSLALR